MYCSSVSPELDQNQLQPLYKLGLEIQTEFNYPRNIEWAIKKDKVFIFK